MRLRGLFLLVVMVHLLPRTKARDFDVDTTLSLTTEAFWRLAQSDSVYRSSRTDTRYVKQKVVELSKWGNSTTDSVDNTELVASPLPPRGDVLEAISSPTTENLPQHLHRTVHLLNSVICPLGSSESQVLQHHTLAAQDDIMTHVTVDYGTGIPMIAGELVVKISTDIARDADNPEVSRVRVVVSVGDIRLPRLLRWLQGTIKHAVRASAVSQVTQWFTAMVEAEEAQRHTAT